MSSVLFAILGTIGTLVMLLALILSRTLIRPRPVVSPAVAVSTSEAAQAIRETVDDLSYHLTIVGDSPEQQSAYKYARGNWDEPRAVALLQGMKGVVRQAVTKDLLPPGHLFPLVPIAAAVAYRLEMQRDLPHIARWMKSWVNLLNDCILENHCEAKEVTEFSTRVDTILIFLRAKLSPLSVSPVDSLPSDVATH